MQRICMIVTMIAVASAVGLGAQEAVPRESSPRDGNTTTEQPTRQAVPRGDRSRGDNPQVGTAVPRAARPSPARPPDTRSAAPTTRDRRNTIVVRPPVVHGYYSPYYPRYPRPLYPYGYGAFGLGYFYYDPYRWPAGSPGYSTGYSRPFSTFDIGELRLNVSPRTAQVYVDGYYAGIVDDFDGAFQALKLAAGTYRIDIVAQGRETLTFDVRIAPGQKVTYRGDLERRTW